jgi:hypothetical protein
MQQSLFTAWGLAAKAVLHVVTRVPCPFCPFEAGNKGALANHMTMKHTIEVVEAKKQLQDAQLSLRTQDLLNWLQNEEMMEEQEEEEDAIEVDSQLQHVPLEAFVSALSQPQPSLAGSPAEPAKKRTKGQAKRYQYTVQAKVTAVKMVEALHVDLVAAGTEGAAASVPVTWAMVYEEAQRRGCSIPASNIHKWRTTQRAQLFKLFVGSKRTKRHGSGRHAAWANAEKAVGDWVASKRAASLRVSVSSVKKQLREEAAKEAAGKPELEAQLRRFKFSKHYFRDAFKRMHVTRRRVSSTRNITNQEAAYKGRFMLKSFMALRVTGGDANHSNSWTATVPLAFRSDVLGWFADAAIVSSDEVPFNFLPDGSTVALVGQDAAVRSLRGVGKRAGTAIISFTASGVLLPIVLIFKRTTPFPKKELAHFKKHSGLRVVYSSTSYVNERIWCNTVIDQVLVPYFKKVFGPNYGKARGIHVSDNHSSHQTSGSLTTYEANHIIPFFTPPNQTGVWSPVDDRVGQFVRSDYYSYGTDYEEEYFDENPEGDGAVAADERRMLMATWWQKAYENMQRPEFQQQMRNSMTRCGFRRGISVDLQDADRMPAPPRFQSTAYARFAETLVEGHPDYNNVTPYVCSLPVPSSASAPDPVTGEMHAEDEDGHSCEQPYVALESEAVLEEPEPAVDDDDGVDGSEEDSDEAVAPAARNYREHADLAALLQAEEERGKERRRKKRLAREAAKAGNVNK